MNRSCYWTLHAINGLGQHQPFILEQIQAFIHQQPLGDLNDRQAQGHLVALENHKAWAHFSLRCFVSAILLYECLDKAKKYGAKHQFTAAELLPLVMDPRPTTDLRQYPIPQAQVSLTSKILEDFIPEKSNLSTYTKLCLKGWGELKVFFLEHGLLEVTDWFLLCDRTPSGLARILTEYAFPLSCFPVERQGLADSASPFTYAPAEISAAVQLLQCFHQVYCQQRQTAGTYRKPYLPPSPSQLEQMGRLLDRHPDTLLQDLLTLAKILRHYRASYVKLQSEEYADPDPKSTLLHQHLLPYLQSAVTQVLRHRYRHHKQAKKRAQYKQALDLFFAQSISTVEIAQRFGISQPTASRLLDLNSLREDVTVEILVQAPRDLLLHLDPSHPPTPAELERANAYVNKFLQKMMATDASQTYTSRNRAIDSPFAQAICQTLLNLEP